MTIVYQFSMEELKSHTLKALAAVAVFAGLVMVSHCGTGCLGAQAPNTKEAAYTAAIVECASVAKTKAEDHACRVSVNKRFGVCDKTQPAGVCE